MPPRLKCKPIVPPDIPAGLPSALLERRPDILTAEQQLRFRQCSGGGRNSQFLPADWSYRPLLGAPVLRLVCCHPGSPQFGESPAIFQAHVSRRSPQSTKAAERGLLGANEASICANHSSCFQDVSNALVSRQSFEAVRDGQTQAVQAYQESVKVSFQRYVAGKASYFEVWIANFNSIPQRMHSPPQS